MTDSILDSTVPQPQSDSAPLARTDSEPPADEVLVGRYRRGELPAFEGLFTRHARAVHDFFFYMTYSREQAVHLSQEAWLQVRRHRDELAADARFLPWLFGQAAQVRRTLSPAAVADMAASDRRSLPASSPALLALTPDLVTDPPTQESAAIAPVYRALAAMADSYREVLVLHRLSGLSFADIAVALGATEAAVKARALQGYVLLAEVNGNRASPPAANEPAGPRPAAPLPLSRCPETEKLINLVVASPESKSQEPLSTLVEHTHDCPLCEVTAEKLAAGYRELGRIAALARPETAALEQIAREVLPAVAQDFAPQGSGWALMLAALSLLLLAGALVGLFLR